MKKLPQHLEQSLSDYLDGTMEPGQRKAFELQLQQEPAWQQRLEELLAAERLLRQSVAEQPSRNFTATVMSRLDQYPLRQGLSIRNGIMLLAGILAVTATAVVLLSAGVFNDSATFDLNNLGLAQRYLRQTLPSIPVDGKLVVNTIVLLNLALAFVVLDRAILRPLFQRREFSRQ